MARGPEKKVHIDAAELRDLTLHHSDLEIAKIVGLSGVRIGQLRHEYGVPTLSPRQRRDLPRKEAGLLTVDDLTPARLADLNAQMGATAIGKLCGVSKVPILRLMKKWGVKAISKSERSTSLSTMTDEQKEIIIGTLLGDAHLLSRGVYKVSHSHNQFDYLCRLQALLSPHARPIFYEEKITDESVCFAFGFLTVQHVWLKALRSVFYTAAGRTFPLDVLTSLSARSLAYWYFDDGHLDSGLPSIALGDISEGVAESVVRVVGSRFRLDTYVKPQSTPTCKLLGVRARSADIFFTLIGGFATVDMLYKLPAKHWPQGITPRLAVRTSSEVVLPPSLRDRCKGWEVDEDPRLPQELVEFWHQQGFPHSVPRPEELTTLHHLHESHVIQDGKVKPRFVGQATCHAFAKHIWSARSYGSKWSPLDIFESPELLEKALRVRLQAGRVSTAAEVRSAVRSWRYSGVYNFRPSAAKALVDRYCRSGGVVWDPCAGYGGRLLGTVLSRALPRYVACDPQPETIARLRDLVRWADSYITGFSDRVELRCASAEESDPPSRVDLLITSPPYWRREVYDGDSPTQAGVRYSTYEAWLTGFWRPVLERGWRALVEGGWVVLNVDDFQLGGKLYELVTDTVKLCADVGMGAPVEVFRYMVPRPGDRDNSEAILCYRKGRVVLRVDVGGSDEPISLSRCSECGMVVSVESLHGGVCSRCLEPAGIEVVCEGCEKRFVASRRGTRFCGKACHARWRRRKQRQANPPSGNRTFQCRDCDESWVTSEKGCFKWCPSCQERRDLERRAKVCAYRECVAAFVDTSPKNGMKFCCPKHRRQEKWLRKAAG